MKRNASPGEPRRLLASVLELQSWPDECIDWPFGCDDHGYGAIRLDGEVARVHAVACEHRNGPRPDGMDARHLCGRGHLGCFNPAHLEWSTRAVNCADKVIHGTRQVGERNGLHKLTEADVQAIRRMYVGRGGPSQKSIGDQFGVHNTVVSQIVRRKIWTHLTAVLPLLIILSLIPLLIATPSLATAPTSGPLPATPAPTPATAPSTTTAPVTTQPSAVASATAVATRIGQPFRPGPSSQYDDVSAPACNEAGLRCLPFYDGDPADLCAEMNFYIDQNPVIAGVDRFSDQPRTGPKRQQGIGWRESNCRNDVRTSCCYGYFQIAIGNRTAAGYAAAGVFSWCGVERSRDFFGDDPAAKQRQVCVAAGLYQYHLANGPYPFFPWDSFL